MNSRAFSGREKKGSKLELPTRQMLNLAPGFCCSLILPLLSRWEQHTCQVDPGGGNFSRNGRRPVSWVADSPATEPFRGSLPKVCRPHLTIDACYLNSANTQRTLKTHSVHPFQLLEYQIWQVGAVNLILWGYWSLPTVHKGNTPGKDVSVLPHSSLYWCAQLIIKTQCI